MAESSKRLALPRSCKRLRCRSPKSPSFTRLLEQKRAQGKKAARKYRGFILSNLVLDDPTEETEEASTSTTTNNEDTSSSSIASTPLPSPPPPSLTSSKRRELRISGLLRAALEGDVEGFKKEARLAPDGAWMRRDARGRSLLHLAAVSGCHAILRMVLAAKVVDVDDAHANGGIRPLTYALDRNDKKAAVMLLVAGADPGDIERKYGCWNATWAQDVMGLSGSMSRSEVLTLLRTALKGAVLRKDKKRRPWLDLATQQILFNRWLTNLREGAKIDCLDCDGKWYEAQVVAHWPDSRLVRVQYRCWGPKFNEVIHLDSLRVLPPYSVVAPWRQTLCVGSQVEILSSAWLPRAVLVEAGGKERKWYDATVKACDRMAGRVLLGVDGRAGLSRWVEIEGNEISDIQTHVKPLQALQPLQPLTSGKKASVPLSPRQDAAREAVKAQDIDALLTLISIDDPYVTCMQYWRGKVEAVTSSTLDPVTEALGARVFAERRLAGYLPMPVIEGPATASISTSKRGDGGGREGNRSYFETRRAVMAHVVTELKSDLLNELLIDYLRPC